MNFTLNILGTASALPIINRYPSAQVLDVRGRLFLIDCGEGVQTQLRKMHLSFLRIETILISHLHGDHTYGIFGLLSTMSMLGRTNPLDIYAPADFSHVLDCYLKYFGEGIQYEIRHRPLTMDQPEKIFETSLLDVYAFPLNHRIRTFGFLFREKIPPLNVRKESIGNYGLSLAEIGALKRGEDVVREERIIPCEEVTYRPYEPRSYAYCSDTAPFPQLPEWVKGVDLLYHECTFPKDMTEKAAVTFHSTTEQAARCAAEAGVKRLVVGHYSSRYPDPSFFLDEIKEIFPDAVLGDDCMTIEVPLKSNR